jgi:hypothetical protein
MRAFDLATLLRNIPVGVLVEYNRQECIQRFGLATA